MKKVIGIFASYALLSSLPMLGGCAAPSDDFAEQVGSDDSVSFTEIIFASPETTASTSIAYWQLEADEHGAIAQAFDDADNVVGQVVFSEWRDGAESGKQIASSDGGLIRLNSEGDILEIDYSDKGDELFHAFVVDSADFRAQLEAESFRSCSFWDWLGCGTKVLGAIAKCGPGAVVCAAKILGVGGKCYKCFVKESAGGPDRPSKAGGGVVDPLACENQREDMVTNC